MKTYLITYGWGFRGDYPSKVSITLENAKDKQSAINQFNYENKEYSYKVISIREFKDSYIEEATKYC